MPSPPVRAINGRLGLTDPNAFSAERSPFIEQTDNEPMRATYGLFLPGVTPAANPSDVLAIAGSATKIIRVKSILLAGTATAATNVIARLIRRSAANTGGTASAPVGVTRDTANDAATAALQLYSANPTGLGAAVGEVDGGRLNLAPAANGSIDRLLFQYSWQMDQAFVLRGASQFLCLNFNGGAWPAGGLLDISIMWTEE
jgi:hypothetical protein